MGELYRIDMQIGAFVYYDNQTLDLEGHHLETQSRHSNMYAIPTIDYKSSSQFDIGYWVQDISEEDKDDLEVFNNISNVNSIQYEY